MAQPTLTPVQILIAEALAKYALAIEKFGIKVESDSQDGLNNQEMLGLVFETPALVVAVKGIIEQRKAFRLENAETQAAIYAKIGEIINADTPGATQKVALAFDYVSEMAGVATTVIVKTKAFAKAMRGEVAEVKTRKARTTKVVDTNPVPTAFPAGK